MDAIAGYILRLVCGAIVCALILALTGTGGASGQLRKMLCGLFLAYLAISPLRNMDIGKIVFQDERIALQAERYVQAGTDQARTAMEDIIKAQCASYILTKAEELRLLPGVEVELNPQTGEPVSVALRGEATPYEKAVLCDYIMQTLGIERSGIQWTP